MIVDETDVLRDEGEAYAACLRARHHLRPSVFPGLLALAATGALFSAWLARQLDPAHSQHLSE